MTMLYISIEASARGQQVLEPLHRALGVSLKVVLVVDEVEPEPGGVAGRPLPVVQQRPGEVATHVAAVLPASDIPSLLRTNEEPVVVSLILIEQYVLAL